MCNAASVCATSIHRALSLPPFEKKESDLFPRVSLLPVPWSKGVVRKETLGTRLERILGNAAVMWKFVV